MGMRIPSGASGVQGGAAVWQQRQQSMQALRQALNSNDLETAKAAYSSMTSNGAGASSSNPNSPLALIGKALANGDLAGAQQAMAQMRHHRPAEAAAPTPPSAAAPAIDSTGGNVNVYV